jgi:hypothetical protein
MEDGLSQGTLVCNMAAVSAGGKRMMTVCLQRKPCWKWRIDSNVKPWSIRGHYYHDMESIVDLRRHSR